MSSMQDPEELRAEIERTRLSISNNVDELSDTLRPGNVVRRQTDKAKNAFGNLTERVMGSDDDPATSSGPSLSQRRDDLSASVAERRHELGETVAERRQEVTTAVSEAPTAVRQRTQGNPLAAGLIAFGVGWLASSLLPSTRAERDLTAEVGERAQPLVADVKAQAQEFVEDLKPQAEAAVSEVKDSASHGVQAVREESQHSAEALKGQAHDAGDRVRDN